MADQIEEIYKSFVEALDIYNQAVEAVTNAVNQLKTAERKLEGAMDDFTQYMGDQEYSSENFPDGGLSLLGKLTKGSKDFRDFFDIGSLF
jgi:hypothetical protein